MTYVTSLLATREVLRSINKFKKKIYLGKRSFYEIIRATFFHFSMTSMSSIKYVHNLFIKFKKFEKHYTIIFLYLGNKIIVACL